jgi:hypothetical protein
MYASFVERISFGTPTRPLSGGRAVSDDSPGDLTKNPPMPQKNISLEILTSSPHLDTPNIRIGGRSAAMRVIPESQWEVY